MKILLDCDARPICPNGWEIVEHRAGGQLEIDFLKVRLHLDEAQVTGTICGKDLREKISSKRVLNACVHDFLLAHSNLIPESWQRDDCYRRRYIFFWGTIFCDNYGYLCVRCLYWDGKEWTSGSVSVDGKIEYSYMFDNRSPAAILL